MPSGLSYFCLSSSVYLWYPKTLTVGYPCVGQILSQNKMGLRGRFWMCWDRKELGPAPELCWLCLKPTPTRPPGRCGALVESWLLSCQVWLESAGK